MTALEPASNRMCDTRGLCCVGTRGKGAAQARGLAVFGGARVLLVRALAACVIGAVVLLRFGG